MAFASLADLVKHYESSGGNYTASNPNTSASGAYQFTTATWQQYAQSVPGASQYQYAAAAPPAVQDAVFAHTVSQVGLAPWTCPGCNSNISNAVANDPSLTQLPALPGGASVAGLGPDTSGQGYGSNGVSGTFTYEDPTTGKQLGSGSFGGNQPTASSIAGDADVGFAPGIYGGPQETGLSPGTAATVAGVGTTIGGAVTGAGTAVGNAITGVGTTFKNFFTGWISSLENWVGRGFLILIGLVILAIALWRIVDPDGSKTAAITRNVEVAA